MSSKSKVTITPGAVVCNECELRGEVRIKIHLLDLLFCQVTIGPRTVVHPKARIIAEAGPIFIGEGNLIGQSVVLGESWLTKPFCPEEQSEIINRAEEGTEPGATVPVMIIGNNNVFEVRSEAWRHLPAGRQPQPRPQDRGQQHPGGQVLRRPPYQPLQRLHRGGRLQAGEILCSYMDKYVL
jgi:hypothetical protein